MQNNTPESLPTSISTIPSSYPILSLKSKKLLKVSSPFHTLNESTPSFFFYQTSSNSFKFYSFATKSSCHIQLPFDPLASIAIPGSIGGSHHVAFLSPSSVEIHSISSDFTSIRLRKSKPIAAHIGMLFAVENGLIIPGEKTFSILTLSQSAIRLKTRYLSEFSLGNCCIINIAVSRAGDKVLVLVTDGVGSKVVEMDGKCENEVIYSNQNHLFARYGDRFEVDVDKKNLICLNSSDGKEERSVCYFSLENKRDLVFRKLVSIKSEGEIKMSFISDKILIERKEGIYVYDEEKDRGVRIELKDKDYEFGKFELMGVDGECFYVRSGKGIEKIKFWGEEFEKLFLNIEEDKTSSGKGNVKSDKEVQDEFENILKKYEEGKKDTDCSEKGIENMVKKIDLGVDDIKNEIILVNKNETTENKINSEVGNDKENNSGKEYEKGIEVDSKETANKKDTLKKSVKVEKKEFIKKKDSSDLKKEKEKENDKNRIKKLEKQVLNLKRELFLTKEDNMLMVSKFNKFYNDFKSSFKFK